jgi:hypothetical protein
VSMRTIAVPRYDEQSVAWRRLAPWQKFPTAFELLEAWGAENAWRKAARWWQERYEGLASLR